MRGNWGLFQTLLCEAEWADVAHSLTDHLRDLGPTQHPPLSLSAHHIASAPLPALRRTASVHDCRLDSLCGHRVHCDELPASPKLFRRLLSTPGARAFACDSGPQSGAPERGAGVDADSNLSLLIKF